MTDDVWSFPQELAHSGRERSVWIRDSGNIRINRMLCTCEGWAAACGWSVCSRHNKDSGACETRVLGVRWCDIVCGSDSRVSSVGCLVCFRAGGVVSGTCVWVLLCMVLCWPQCLLAGLQELRKSETTLIRRFGGRGQGRTVRAGLVFFL